jgi:hypothetical protein
MSESLAGMAAKSFQIAGEGAEEDKWPMVA